MRKFEDPQAMHDKKDYRALRQDKFLELNIIIPMITFQPMTGPEFTRYQQTSIVSYAEDKKLAENLSDESALKLSQQTYAELLPDGLRTPEQHFFSIALNGAVIGMLWLAEKQTGTNKTGFIYDFLIQENFRGKGFGKQALEQLDVVARKLGMSAIKLHVFEHNTYARMLYEKMGFKTAGRSMVKNL